MDHCSFKLRLPPTELDPNKRSHWAKKANAKKKYREACALTMLADRPKIDIKPVRGQLPLEEAGIYIRWNSNSNKPKDPDNIIAHCKTAIDALQDANILKNDRFIKWILSEWNHRKGDPGLELKIYAITLENMLWIKNLEKTE